jgi:hypothetical protein
MMRAYPDRRAPTIGAALIGSREGISDDARIKVGFSMTRSVAILYAADGYVSQGRAMLGRGLVPTVFGVGAWAISALSAFAVSRIPPPPTG